MLRITRSFLFIDFWIIIDLDFYSFLLGEGSYIDLILIEEKGEKKSN